MADGYQIPPELIPYIIQYLTGQGQRSQGTAGQATPEQMQLMAEAGLLDDELALKKLLLESRMGQQENLAKLGEADAGQAMPSWDSSNIANPGQGALWLFERLRGEKQAQDARDKMESLLGQYGTDVGGLLEGYRDKSKTIAQLMAERVRAGAPPQVDPQQETNRRIDQYSGLNNPLSPIAQAARAARGGQ